MASALWRCSSRMSSWALRRSGHACDGERADRQPVADLAGEPVDSHAPGDPIAFDHQLSLDTIVRHRHLVA